jgi:chromosome segregation ATPase
LSQSSHSKSLCSPGLESEVRKKKGTAFITQKKVSEVEAAHDELNTYIDVLDDKVSKFIERNEAEFLVAYRNHIKKVREEMEEIRNKALSNANSSVGQIEKIESLEKQLVLFREESLKLFEKVNDKDRTICILETRMRELESERSHLEQRVKVLTKRNK